MSYNLFFETKIHTLIHALSFQGLTTPQEDNNKLARIYDP